jgi:hypothetical protein
MESARDSSRSSELAPPTPSTASECVPHHDLSWGGGGGGEQNQDEGTYTMVLTLYTNPFSLVHIEKNLQIHNLRVYPGFITCSTWQIIWIESLAFGGKVKLPAIEVRFVFELHLNSIMSKENNEKDSESNVVVTSISVIKIFILLDRTACHCISKKLKKRRRLEL